MKKVDKALSNSHRFPDEIALVVEDEGMICTTMNGLPYMAGQFAVMLRRKLFRGRFVSCWLSRKF